MGILPLRCEHVFLAVLLLEVAAMFRTSWLWIAAIGLFSGSESRGEGLPWAGERSEPSIKHIAAWIEQLDCPAYGERQFATQQLEGAGAAALADLENVVVSGSREASGRALDILKRHFQSGTDELKLAARDALARLAEDSNASTAQRARNILNPRREPGATAIGAQQAMPPRINFFAGGLPANPAFFRRVSVSVINGRKSLDIDDRERRIRMETVPNGSIEIEVTDKQNIRNPIRRLAAKDLDDLKRKDAELGRLYEEHSAAVGRPPAGFGIHAPPGNRAPAPARPPTRTVR